MTYTVAAVAVSIGDEEIIRQRIFPVSEGSNWREIFEEAVRLDIFEGIDAHLEPATNKASVVELVEEALRQAKAGQWEQRETFEHVEKYLENGELNVAISTFDSDTPLVAAVAFLVNGESIIRQELVEVANSATLKEACLGMNGVTSIRNHDYKVYVYELVRLGKDSLKLCLSDGVRLAINFLDLEA